MKYWYILHSLPFVKPLPICYRTNEEVLGDANDSWRIQGRQFTVKTKCFSRDISFALTQAKGLLKGPFHILAQPLRYREVTTDTSKGHIVKFAARILFILVFISAVSNLMAADPSEEDLFSDLKNRYGVNVEQASLVSGLKLLASAKYAGGFRYDITFGLEGNADLLSLVTRVTYAIGPDGWERPKLNHPIPTFHHPDFQKYNYGFFFTSSEERDHAESRKGFQTTVRSTGRIKQILVAEVVFADGSAATLGEFWNIELEHLLAKPQRTTFHITPNYGDIEAPAKKETSLLSKLGNFLPSIDDKPYRYLKNYQVKIEGPKSDDIDRVEYVIRHSYLCYENNQVQKVDIKQAELDEGNSFTVNCEAIREKLDGAHPLSSCWQLYIIVVFKDGTMTSVYTKRFVALSKKTVDEGNYGKTEIYIGSGNDLYVNGTR